VLFGSSILTLLMHLIIYPFSIKLIKLHGLFTCRGKMLPNLSVAHDEIR